MNYLPLSIALTGGERDKVNLVQRRFVTAMTNSIDAVLEKDPNNDFLQKEENSQSRTRWHRNWLECGTTCRRRSSIGSDSFGTK